MPSFEFFWRASRNDAPENAEPSLSTQDEDAPKERTNITLDKRPRTFSTNRQLNATPTNVKALAFLQSRSTKDSRRAEAAHRTAVEVLSCLAGVDVASKGLKNRLKEPAKARLVVNELKALPDPFERATGEKQTCVRHRALYLSSPTHDDFEGHTLVRIAEENETGQAEQGIAEPPSLPIKLYQLASSIPSSSDVIGQAIKKTGAFDVLAEASGSIIQHADMASPPLDRMSLLLYWWGFEICIPPASIQHLKSAHSISSTIFAFLQAMTASGAPELIPFIRYLSMWTDMEWQAILANNRGNGVVLAATWVQVGRSC